MTNPNLNFPTPSAHQVLAAPDKEYLRPGGWIGTQLLQWADYQLVRYG